MVDSTTECATWFVSTTNIFGIIFGTFFVAFGIWLDDQARFLACLVDYMTYSEFSGTIICTGLAMIFFGIIGTYGVVKERAEWISCYLVGIGFLFAYHLMYSLKATDIEKFLRDSYEDSLNDTLSHDYMRDDCTKKAWDYWQYKFECCGVQNHTDWLSVMNRYPDSCCTETTMYERCGEDALFRDGTIHDEGCLAKVIRQAKDIHYITISVTYLFVTLEFLAFFTALLELWYVLAKMRAEHRKLQEVELQLLQLENGQPQTMDNITVKSHMSKMSQKEMSAEDNRSFIP